MRTLNDENYIEQPEVFAQGGANGKTLYCKLQKCLYGVKQAGRAGRKWNTILTQWFWKNEFIQSAVYCLFRCDGIIGFQLFVLVWVDNLLYISNKEKMLHDFKAKFSDAFSIDDCKKVPWFLGFNVEQSHGRISLSQRSNIKDILRKSHMSG